MTKFLQILTVGFVAGYLMSCGVAERSARHSSGSPDSPPSDPLPAAASVSKYKEVQVSLEQAHREWKGTPYVLGGTSSRGIDCSAFMQILFDKYFGITLPRNTKRQLYYGSEVKRDALTTGDLVFFKTGRKTLHVGVIVEDEEFLHASTSRGVTISKLDDYYWNSRYLSGRRVMELR